MTAMFEITQAERAGWQRRAAARLAAILDEHRGLPLITWMVVPAGSTLVGRLDSVGPASQVRAAFDGWCRALGAGERAETVSPSGNAFLWATARTGRVRVTLTATVCGDGEFAGTQR